MTDRSRHLDPASQIKFCEYYGKDRKRYLEKIENYTLVITTYSIVRIDWKLRLEQPEASPTLYSKKWGRLVLDEGRQIASQ